MIIQTTEDVIDLVAEVFRAQLLKAMVERPDAKDRETLSENFANDTFNMIATFLENSPEEAFDTRAHTIN